MINKKEKTCYAIDLNEKNIQIKLFSGIELEKDLKHFKVRDPRKLSDYDRKVFLNLKEAEKYLKIYMKTLKGLSNSKICKKTGIPAILYKRRYIVQSLLGEKNQTFRDSPRVIKMMNQIKVGDMFNLYDQTFRLTVVLTKVTQVDERTYKYNFRLP